MEIEKEADKVVKLTEKMANAKNSREIRKLAQEIQEATRKLTEESSTEESSD
jgi:predicted  nucleic acid-binding Zn-ribbon protein